MKVFPVRDQVVVLKAKEEEKVSQGGIIQVSLGSSSPTGPRHVEGTVVAVGSGRITMNGSIIPLEVKEGDKVVFNPSMATEIQSDGTTYLVLREDNLFVLR